MAKKATDKATTCTRRDYLENKCSHDEYYAQFVNEEVKSTLLQNIPKDEILQSKDEHFNDIPLKRWDALPLSKGTADELRAKGDYPTLAGKVCIYKAAARQIKTKDVHPSA